MSTGQRVRDMKQSCLLFFSVASAVDDQRRADEDSPVEILGPEASSIAKKRAAKRRFGRTTH